MFILSCDVRCFFEAKELGLGSKCLSRRFYWLKEEKWLNQESFVSERREERFFVVQQVEQLVLSILEVGGELVAGKTLEC